MSVKRYTTSFYTHDTTESIPCLAIPYECRIGPILAGDRANTMPYTCMPEQCMMACIHAQHAVLVHDRTTRCITCHALHAMHYMTACLLPMLLLHVLLLELSIVMPLSDEPACDVWLSYTLHLCLSIIILPSDEPACDVCL